MDNKIDIKKTQHADRTELKITGRIDASGSQTLNQFLEEEIHHGNYIISLDLSEVQFLSSAGIRILILYNKKLKELNGSFRVSKASEFVISILNMVGAADLIISEKEQPKKKEAISHRADFSEKGITFKSTALNPEAKIRYRLIGQPEMLRNTSFKENECTVEKFSGNKFGIGLGATGSGFQDCADRFGEFAALNGAVFYLPTDGAKQPDYSIASGTFVPEINMVYGITGEGDFSAMINIHSADDSSLITLSALIDKIFETVNSDTAAIIYVAESDGLVGASLSKSPFSIKGTSPFSFPEVRETINFTTERVFSQTIAVTIGFVSKNPDEKLKNFLRPMNADGKIYGHFHSIVFPFRPLKKNITHYNELLLPLIENEQILSVIHLLNDDREIVGLGDSEFRSGVCWAGRAEEIK